MIELHPLYILFSWQFSVFYLSLSFSHPMVVSTTLRARNYRDVIFVSDSVLEPKPGATAGYSDRKGLCHLVI